MKRHIAILGGAFNPITNGHIETAQFILQKLSPIEEVWITPVYIHAYNKEMLSPKHRLNMCKLAINDKRIKLFDYEIKNELKDGTLNFFKILNNDKKFSNLDFSWVIGMDNANTISKWINSKELINAVRFIVILRNGVERDMNENWYMQYPHVFLNKTHNIIEISSTQIRNMLVEYYETNSMDILIELKKYLNPKVLDYIIKNKLYLQYEKSNRIYQKQTAKSST